VSQRRPREHGFSLIELLIVIIIIGILAAIAIPIYVNQRNKAKDAAIKEGIHSIQIGVETFTADHNDTFPATGSLNEVLSDTYVEGWPNNPFTNVAMRSSSSVGDYTYTNNADSFTLTGNLSNGSRFTVGLSGGPAATGFTAVSGNLIALQLAYFAKHGYWPRSWAPYCYTDLGLDPAQFAAAQDHVFYTVGGTKVNARPEAGYVMTVTDASGTSRVLTNKLSWNLTYDATSGQWYYHTIDPANLVDITTLKVTPG